MMTNIASSTALRRAVALIAAVCLTLMCALAVVPAHRAFALSGGSADAGTSAGGSDGSDASDGSDGGASAGSGTGNATTLAEDGGTGMVDIAGPVPNVIITNFTYGGDSVAAGSKFDLAFTFQNMGQVAIGNMVITVDGGENFAISSGTNTFYVDSLWAGYAMTQTVGLQALSSAKSGAQPVQVSFKYEYVESNSRSSSQADITLSVPVSQPDRFQLNDPVVPDATVSGEESTVTMEYVNKGKGDIANVEASISGDGLSAATESQYIGNVASGASGSIGFVFTPEQSGEINATLKVTYEDSDGQQQTKEFPVTINAVEPEPINVDPVIHDEEETGLPVWAWVLIALGVIAVVALIVVMVVRRRARKSRHAAHDDDDDDWNWDEVLPSGASEQAQSVDSERLAAGDQASPQEATQIIEPMDGTSSTGGEAR